MKILNLKFGKIYIEELNEDEPFDYIIVYDSRMEFLDLFSKEFFYDNNDQLSISKYNYIKNKILACQTPEELCEYMGINNFLITKDLKEAYNLALKEEYLEKEDIEDFTKEDSLLKNEWVNKVGQYYIIVKQY